ncbi:hypothetical protein IDM40_26710 [Nocardiopsis sp. HNM0947]|uniref:Helicase XPB/Ssl2 N-terminal domain-containing protein n=1 Tax=Nocardiopsis coralli TaxID=2772213 RepID=A0ABR9PEI7_9ACTN|nr:hypothetical protein [Nocardiopsis coralli]MBE3002264.1 hypothetical protein [Nocardiopsis coralli]
MTERISSAVRSCLEWSRGLHPPTEPDPDALTLVLHAHRDCGAPDPGDWTVEDVHEVASAVHGYRGGPETLRSAWLLWCDHLVERGGLAPGPSPRALRGAIATVDLTEPRSQEEETVPGLTPLLQRLGVGCPSFEGLPAVVAAPPEELDSAALRCTPLAEAARLTVWVDRGRDLAPDTAHDALRPEDLADAARAMETGPGPVHAAFRVAREAGLLRTTYTRILPGPATRDWSGRVPGAVADAWADALPAMTGLRGLVSYLVLTELFVTGESRTPADLAEACAVGPADGAEVRRAVEVLQELGALTGDGGRDGDLRITPLGDHFMVRQLTRADVPVTVLPDLSSLPGNAALEVVTGAGRPSDTELVLSHWLARQDEQGLLSTAVAEVFDACAAPHQWRSRAAATRLLRCSSPDLGEVLPFHVHHPVVGGWARRLQPGHMPDPSSHQDVWAALDDHALLMEDGSAPPEDTRLSVRAEELVHTVSVSGHPRAPHVLDLFVEGVWGRGTALAAANARATDAAM